MDACLAEPLYAYAPLPLANHTVITSEDRVDPWLELRRLLSFANNHLLIQLDTKTRCGQEVDGAVVDLEDFGVLHVGKEIKAPSVVVHLPRHLADNKVGCGETDV